jgi:hypothetical protein
LRLALLWCACDAEDFYGFPPDELSSLFKRLNRNVAEAKDGSDELEAHTMIRDRIEDVVLYLVEQHPRYLQWTESFQEKRSVPPSSKPSIAAKPRGRHLRLV